MTEDRLLNSEVCREILEELDESKHASPSGLSEELDRNRSTISTLLNEMERLELVNGERRQAKLYEITERGKEFLTRVIELQEEEEDLMDWLYRDANSS